MTRLKRRLFARATSPPRPDKPLETSTVIGRRTSKHGTKLVVLYLGLVCVGCAQGAKLTRDTPAGGVVTFPVHTDADRVSSQARSEALALIEQKCGKAYKIVREGEVPRVSAAADRAWRGQMAGDRLWGMEFTCQ